MFKIVWQILGLPDCLIIHTELNTYNHQKLSRHFRHTLSYTLKFTPSIRDTGTLEWKVQ